MPKNLHVCTCVHGMHWNDEVRIHASAMEMHQKVELTRHLRVTRRVEYFGGRCAWT